MDWLRRWIAAVSVIGLTLLASSGAAMAHPNGWDTWKEFRNAHLHVADPSLVHDEIPTPHELEEHETYHLSLERLRERWREFDHRYWESVATPSPSEPVGQEPASNGDAYDTDSSGVCWDCIAECESGGNWHINTGNGYYGGLQFSLSTWHAYGGTGYPHEHSREQQIAIASGMSLSHWPICGAYG